MLRRPLLQAAVLGALSVMLVDRTCREPFVTMEPACATLFALWCAGPGREVGGRRAEGEGGGLSPARGPRCRAANRLI
jgi:hypothetical protein